MLRIERRGVNRSGNRRGGGGLCRVGRCQGPDPPPPIRKGCSRLQSAHRIRTLAFRAASLAAYRAPGGNIRSNSLRTSHRISHSRRICSKKDAFLKSSALRRRASVKSRARTIQYCFSRGENGPSAMILRASLISGCVRDEWLFDPCPPKIPYGNEHKNHDENWPDLDRFRPQSVHSNASGADREDNEGHKNNDHR